MNEVLKGIAARLLHARAQIADGNMDGAVESLERLQHILPKPDLRHMAAAFGCDGKPAAAVRKDLEA